MAEVRIGGVPPEINPEWPVAAVLADSKDSYSLVRMSRTETLECWSFGVEMILQMS